MSTKHVPLAIVGMACRFPKADGARDYWGNILNGADCITDIPKTHWRVSDYFNEDPKTPDSTYAKRGGFLSEVKFNPLEFGIPPTSIEATDTSQLLGLVTAAECLADAGYGPDSKKALDKDRVSVVLGVTGALELVIPLGARLGHPIWRRALAAHGVDDALAEKIVADIADGYVPWQEQSFPGLLGNVVAGRIANYLDLGGTNCVADAACASALSAVHLAGLELQSGRADMVLTGGVDTFNDIFMYMCFSKTPALSPSGDARPFDADGDGTMLGEGVGVIALKRLEDAERDGDHVYAVLRGIGSSSDGKGNAIYAPSAKGQTKALRRAYEAADVDPSTIELVEAHGTGTKVGDAVEVNALNEVYANTDGRDAWCALGSVKSQIGHTKAAAGIAGLIKAAMALNRKVLPPTIKINQPTAKLTGPNSALYLNTSARPWMPKNHPRRAAVSAFGFGGSNFHCVLEEHQPQKAQVDWDGTVQILAFSAQDKQTLRRQISDFDGALPWSELEIAAAKQRLAFEPARVRLLLVVEKDKTDIPKLLGRALALMDNYRDQASWSAPEGVYFGSGEPVGKLGLLFPGQGAQYVNMMRDMACRFPMMQGVLADVDLAFEENTPGAPRLSDLIYPRPAFDEAGRSDQEATLRETQNAQPAIGAVSIGALKVLNQFGIQPQAAAGHSYGEITALCASERFDTQALYLLSRLRGKLMAQGSGDRGAMLAVRAPVEKVALIVSENRLDLTPANKNAPEQIVLSGPTHEIDRAEKIFAKHQISNKRLPVAAAFHSSLVAQAEKPFSIELAKIQFSAGSVPVYSNTTANPYPTEPGEARQLLATQLTRPVEFVDEIRNMYADGVRTFLEVGPGARLTGLVKSILSGQTYNALAVDASSGKRSGVCDLARVLASLAAEGRQVDLKSWENSQDLVDQIKPTRKGMIIPLTGANYRNPKTVAKPAPKPKAKAMATTPVPSVTKESVVQDASRHRTAQTGARTNPVKSALPHRVTPAPHSTTQDSPIMNQIPGSDDAFAVTQRNMILLQQMQESTAKLHHKFLETQAETQRNMHALLEQQRQLLTGAAPVVFAAPQAPVRQVETPQPTSPTMAKPAPTAATQPAKTYPPQVTKTETPTVAASNKIMDTLMRVVAEKTGYPMDMLEAEMSLDADLGIDSIKRVEILSAISEALPEAPSVAPDVMGTIQTLQDIADQFSGSPSTVAPAPAHAQPAASSSVEPLLMAVIAEKTGYPQDMLEPSMSLDADLGIDSIKRVEILSALAEKAPHLPEIKPDEISRLHTLADIVQFLDMQAPAAAPGSAPLTTVDTDQTARVLREVLADKTGYPKDMLEGGMSLDADLGIDSIKRVEILSALQEALPHLPAVEPDQMGQLQTLDDIVAHLNQAAPAPTTTSANTPDVGSALFQILADKTGYPMDMLENDMNLEADLGIDSIKRVEIFSALAEAMPQLPELKPDQLTSFQNLGEIITHLQSFFSVNETVPVPVSDLNARVARALVAVIADKTGYPQDMLDMTMDLEADLGIDSIKRVEILSALQDQVPGLVELPADRMNELHTLNEVVSAFAPATTTAPATVTPKPVPAAKMPSTVTPLKTAEQYTISRSILQPATAKTNRPKLTLTHPLWLVGPKGETTTELQKALEANGNQVIALSLDDAAPTDPAGGLVLVAPQSADDNLPFKALQWVQAAKSPLTDTATNGDALLAAVTFLDGSFGLNGIEADINPMQAVFAGLIKTASHEWPNVHCKVLDLPPHPDTALFNEAAKELLLQGPLETAINAAGVQELQLIKAPVPNESYNPLNEGDVVLITGGARGVTAEAACALAAAFRPTLVLMGRSPLPQADEPEWLRSLTDEGAVKAALAKRLPGKPTPRAIAAEYKAITAAREIRANMARMNAAGAKVVYRSVDLLDPKALTTALNQITQDCGPIKGLVHGAGVLADRLIEDKTQDQFDLVYNTKAKAFDLLLTQLADADLKILVAFSSSTGRFGRKGQVDYAMANEVLNKSANREAKRRPGCRVLSVNWGPWDGGMVNDSLKKVFAAEGVGLIPLDAGAAYLVSELRTPPGNPVETVILGELAGASQAKDIAPVSQSSLESAFEIVLSLESHPFLKSHIINGNPVLPAAMMIEWMAQAALHANPGFRFGGFDTFRVQKGVILEQPTTLTFMTAPIRYTESGARVTVEIVGDQNRRHASAELLLVDTPLYADQAVITAPTKAYHPDTPIYEALFHGPDLQGIQTIVGLNEVGIAANADTAPMPRDWVQKPLRGTWLSDPLALDTAFQLMILWCRDQKDMPSLPTFAAGYRQFGRFPKTGVDIHIQVTGQSAAGATADIEFLDGNSGALIARMTGYECVLDKSLEQAFRRNRVAVGA